MQQPLNCGFCDKRFTPTHHSQKRFCSFECRTKFWNNQKRAQGWRLLGIPPKICEVCSKRFQPYRKSHKYCSLECLWKAHPPPRWNTGIYQIHFWTNQEWIQKNYLDPQISINQVCQKYKISRATFYHWLRRLSLKSLPKSIVQSGEKNPFYGKKHPPEIIKKMRVPHPTQQGSNNHGWKGGHPPYYGPNWHSQRKKARDRDKDTCRDCKLHQPHPRLPVHHIIPFRMFGLERFQEANDLSNLITLCIPCHAKRENLIK